MVSQRPGKDDIGKKEGARWWMTKWPISFFFTSSSAVICAHGEELFGETITDLIGTFFCSPLVCITPLRNHFGGENVS